MERISEVCLKSLDKYYNSLYKLGYMKDSEVVSLIVINYLEELLSNYFHDFVNEEDYRDIISAIYNTIESSCIIEFPDYEEYDRMFNEELLDFVGLLTEDSLLRLDTQDKLKLKV